MSIRDRDQALTVTELTERIKGTLETSFSSIWVSGEISDIARPHSGHVYLTLKDGQSQIRGVMWRSVAQQVPFEMKDGQAVLCFGGIDVYGARGTYQFVIRKVEPQGVGSLQLAFQQLQLRLAAEGLFDPDRKRSLPAFPRRIGFVTSPTGAAARDFLEVASRRWPGVQIMIIPAQVQGAAAVRSICSGIIAANAVTPSLDVLVIGRGGGSLEDLWCFNEELVVRAIAASSIPTVSAVGHEIDVTLADFAADVRALTPSAAAEMVVPDSNQLHALLNQLQKRMARLIRSRVDLLNSRLQSLSNRPVFARPLDRIHDQSRRLDELDLRLTRAMKNHLALSHNRLQKTSATLSALSPVATLARGYSITTDKEGNALRSHTQVQNGDTLTTHLQAGQITSIVTDRSAHSVSNPTN
jgi:exodeoxyribonuclease VII large subunit